jgi:hypothetical protein
MPPPERWSQDLAAYGDAREEFIVAARKDLGQTGLLPMIDDEDGAETEPPV